jgi:hypothetical protein
MRPALGGIILLALAASTVGWRLVQTRRSWQTDNLRAAQETSAPQAKPPQQNAEQPAAQAPAASTAAAEEKETERRLGPFSISGSDYTVVLHSWKRPPGTTQETGDTVVAMEIRDATGAIQYHRKFPYQEADDSFSDAWSVDAHLLAGTNGTGLLVSYASTPNLRLRSGPIPTGGRYLELWTENSSLLARPFLSRVSWDGKTPQKPAFTSPPGRWVRTRTRCNSEYGLATFEWFIPFAWIGPRAK